MSQYKRAIQTPIKMDGMGIFAYNEEEKAAVLNLMERPRDLFRYRGETPTECSMLEGELSAYTGIRHALFVNSGTSALSCCLSAFGIGPGDEVIVPAYTYIATASAVVNVGAVPVIAEIDDSLGLDPIDVEKKITPYTKAIIPVAMQGVPPRLSRLRAIAKAHNLYVIEDCCQAIGARYMGAHTGMESDAMAWSLNYFKVISCAEGGVFFTNDDAAFLRGVYRSDPATPMWDSDLKGELDIPPFTCSGYRASELSACLARVQLRKLDALLAHMHGLKNTVLSALNAPIHYKLQEIDDPQGECGISLALIAESADCARRFSEELLKEGLSIGSAYNSGFPDRHIYAYWDAILQKRGASDKNYPWGDPSYKGNVQYSKDMCPRTLDILARCLRQPMTLGMTEQNALEIAEAINRADTRL